MTTVVDLLTPTRERVRPFTGSQPQAISGSAYHPRIFLIDDNPGELEVLQEALAVIDGAAEIETSTSAHLAMARLSGLGIDAQGVLPDLVVIDIRMPIISGPDLLTGIRAQRELETLPVVMVTGAANLSERERCGLLGAIAVIAKPDDFDGYLGLARQLMGIARTPG
jgi:two-component system, chemotaxis family, response regulator Rcp1